MLGSLTAEWLCNMNEPYKSSGSGRGRRNAGEPAGRRPVQGDAPPRAAATTMLSDAEEDARLRGWVAALIGRDQAALGHLYDATCSRVHGVVLRIVRRADLAEEVLSDVYHQVWRECQRYDPSRGKVIAWLLIIARSRALDALRRADDAFSHPAPEDLLGPDAVLDSDRDPLGLLEAASGNERLHVALASLSPIQRQFIALAFFKGLSHAEIAEHSRLPLGSVKTHIRKALLQLRDVLDSQPAGN